MNDKNDYKDFPMKLPWHGYDEIIDVRTPTEYAEDHLPNACNMPALSDDERAAIGKLHQQSPFAARRKGAGLVAENIARHLREHLSERPPHWRPLIYCWRGGQRSGAVTEVLRRVGWDARQMAGGYKYYRRLVMDGIAQHSKEMRWLIIGGKTGSGKTVVLRQLADCGAQTVDLESLCNHRGSAFGGWENIIENRQDNDKSSSQSSPQFSAQPSQRRFESLLFARLCELSSQHIVFAESESRKIGTVHLPQPLLLAMRQSSAVYLDVPLMARAQHIAAEYCDMRDEKTFVAALDSIAEYVGARRVLQWQKLHAAEQWQPLAAEMLESFYDVGYKKSLAANYSNQAAVFVADPNSPQSMQTVTKALLSFAKNVT